MRPVILDTDIGSDVDDILALVLLAKSPELELIGVTTVYGDTVRRARIAKAACAMLQRPEIKSSQAFPSQFQGDKCIGPGTKERECRAWKRFRSIPPSGRKNIS